MNGAHNPTSVMLLSDHLHTCSTHPLHACICMALDVGSLAITEKACIPGEYYTKRTLSRSPHQFFTKNTLTVPIRSRSRIYSLLLECTYTSVFDFFAMAKPVK